VITAQTLLLLNYREEYGMPGEGKNTADSEQVQEAITENRRVAEEAGAASSFEALYFTSFVMQ